MSAAPRHPADMGYIGLSMSAEEYLSLGQTPERLELVHGVVVMSPSPGPRHQKAIRLILQQLERYAERVGGMDIYTTTDIRLGSTHVYCPDIACYRAGRLAAIPSQLDTPPDLVIEVLSPSTKAFDLTTKRDEYEKFGVGEYWAVDTSAAHVRCYQRRAHALIESPMGADSVTSSALAGLVLDLRPLRQLSRL